MAANGYVSHMTTRRAPSTLADRLLRRLTAALLAVVLVAGTLLAGGAVAMPGSGVWGILCGGGSLVIVPIGEDDREAERQDCPTAALASGLPMGAAPAVLPPQMRRHALTPPAPPAASVDRRPWERRARAPPS
ncbi:MAG: hypothetical protein AAFU72_03680 [Pseudomonadota bacterium]